MQSCINVLDCVDFEVSQCLGLGLYCNLLKPDICNYICSIRHVLIKIIKLLGFSFKGVIGKYLFDFCARPLDHCRIGIPEKCRKL